MLMSCDADVMCSVVLALTIRGYNFAPGSYQCRLQPNSTGACHVDVPCVACPVGHIVSHMSDAVLHTRLDASPIPPIPATYIDTNTIRCTFEQQAVGTQGVYSIHVYNGTEWIGQNQVYVACVCVLCVCAVVMWESSVRADASVCSTGHVPCPQLIPLSDTYIIEQQPYDADVMLVTPANMSAYDVVRYTLAGVPPGWCMHVAWCMLHVVCCMLHDACGMWHGAYCMLHVAWLAQACDVLVYAHDVS